MPCRRCTQPRALLLVEVGDHLGVALRGEAVARALQALAQLAVVVDLAVEDDRDRAVLVEDRLVAGREVDHAQALDPEPDAGIDVQSARVRAAVLERGAHALQSRRVGAPAVTVGLSDDPAHGPLPAAV